MCAAIAAIVMVYYHGLMDVMVYCGWIKVAWVGGLRRASLSLFFLPVLILYIKILSLLRETSFFLRLLDLLVCWRLVTSASFAYFIWLQILKFDEDWASNLLPSKNSRESVRSITHGIQNSEERTSCSRTVLIQFPDHSTKLIYTRATNLERDPN